MQQETDKFPIIVRDFDTLLSVTDRSRKSEKTEMRTTLSANLIQLIEHFTQPFTIIHNNI